MNLKIRAQLWYSLGLMYRFYGLRTGSRQPFMQAEQALCHALEHDPQHHAARFLRGLLRWRELQAPARAVQDFSEVMAQTDRYSDALLMRGMAYQALGDYHAAAHDMAAFIEQYPHSRWRPNAQRQLTLIRAIIEEMRPQLGAISPYLLSEETDS